MLCIHSSMQAYLCLFVHIHNFHNCDALFMSGLIVNQYFDQHSLFTKDFALKSHRSSKFAYFQNICSLSEIIFDKFMRPGGFLLVPVSCQKVPMGTDCCVTGVGCGLGPASSFYSLSLQHYGFHEGDVSLFSHFNNVVDKNHFH